MEWPFWILSTYSPYRIDEANITRSSGEILSQWTSRRFVTYISFRCVQIRRWGSALVYLMSFLRRRQCLCQTLKHSRFSSSIPDNKMRAIVSLYHQSETFITPDTLDSRIDQAFTSRPKMPNYQDVDTLTHKSFTALLAQRRHAPRYVDDLDQHVARQHRAFAGEEDIFSNEIGDENNAVAEALYGVELGHVYGHASRQSAPRYPGLDALRQASLEPDLSNVNVNAKPRPARSIATPPTRAADAFKKAARPKEKKAKRANKAKK